LSLIVVVPVKSSGVKSRLSDVLSPPQRTELSELLLTNVLSAVRGANLLSRTYVVSSDRKMLGLAKRLGAKTAPEDSDAGVNQAVLRGLKEARREDDALVIPSDLPTLEPSDLNDVLSLKSAGLGVVVAPSRAFDGTNALMFPVSSRLPLRYDDNSFWNHIAGAARAGLSLGVCTRPGLMFDVDTPEDLSSLASSKGGGQDVRFARRVLS
jgi:2-phospho-L-lactate/phosphoenolpyruvate guanylyltransferase